MSAQGILLDHDTIAAVARKHWEDEGRPEGRALDHWLKAESELQRLTNVPAPKRSKGQPAGDPSARSPKQENL